MTARLVAAVAAGVLLGACAVNVGGGEPVVDVDVADCACPNLERVVAGLDWLGTGEGPDHVATELEPVDPHPRRVVLEWFVDDLDAATIAGRLGDAGFEPVEGEEHGFEDPGRWRVTVRDGIGVEVGRGGVRFGDFVVVEVAVAVPDEEVESALAPLVEVLGRR